jgi:hypothetical protein
MTGDDWRDPAFKKRHAGYLSLYIQDLIAQAQHGAPLVGLPPSPKQLASDALHYEV